MRKAKRLPAWLGIALTQRSAEGAAELFSKLFARLQRTGNPASALLRDEHAAQSLHLFKIESPSGIQTKTRPTLINVKPRFRLTGTATLFLSGRAFE